MQVLHYKNLNRTFSVAPGESCVKNPFFLYLFISLYMISNVVHTENEQKAGGEMDVSPGQKP